MSEIVGAYGAYGLRTKIDTRSPPRLSLDPAKCIDALCGRYSWNYRGFALVCK